MVVPFSVPLRVTLLANVAHQVAACLLLLFPMMPRQPGFRFGVLATWGKVILEPLDDDSIEKLAAGREIDELNAFLLADDGLENAMDVSTFDGFICGGALAAEYHHPLGMDAVSMGQGGRRAISGVCVRQACSAPRRTACLSAVSIF